MSKVLEGIFGGFLLCFGFVMLIATTLFSPTFQYELIMVFLFVGGLLFIVSALRAPTKK